MHPIEYDNNRRMKYNPDFHENHGILWSEEDLIYLCKNYRLGTRREIAMALGRTEATVANKVCHLRKINKFDYYKNLEEQ